jgi:hypothetical protein
MLGPTLIGIGFGLFVILTIGLVIFGIRKSILEYRVKKKEEKWLDKQNK